MKRPYCIRDFIDNQKIIVMDMKSSDVKDWLELFNLTSEYETAYMTLTEAESHFKPRLGDPNCVDLVAKIGNLLIGYRGLTIFSGESKHVALTAGVYVLPSFRRKGIASLMIKISEDIARQKGVKIIHGYTLVTNKPIVQLFTNKLGYVICGSLSRAAKTNNTYVDIVIVYKEL